MVTPILKGNSINNPLIISTDIGDFEFSHSLSQQPTVKTTGIRKGLKMFGTIELKSANF